jgi:hypothetical protein
VSRSAWVLLIPVIILVPAIVVTWLWTESPERTNSPAPLALSAARPPRPESPTWQPLFNGRDLSGWQHLGGGRVSVRDGLLILEHDGEYQPGYLISKLTARDFVARVRCKIEQGDSGFFYRCHRDPRTPTTILGPQVQLNRDTHFGGIYETQGRGWVQKPLTSSAVGVGAGWLDGEIAVRRDHVHVIIEGQKLVDFEDDPIGNSFQEAGLFALQIHGGGTCHVLFERIDVQVLDRLKQP